MHFWTFPCALHASPNFVDLFKLIIFNEDQVQTKTQFVILSIFCCFQVLHICYAQIFPTALFSNVLSMYRLRPSLGTSKKQSPSCRVFRIIQETDTAICTQPFKITASIKSACCLYEHRGQSSFWAYQFQIQWRPLIIIANNVINRLLLSKSVVPKHSN
jgi:hypothetical protein